MPLITVFTSAKSRLICPRSLIRSDIPCAAFNSIESAILNESSAGVSFSITDKSFSFGITISVSQKFLIELTPFNAFDILFAPSNLKGNVIMATVRIPKSLHIFATTGAAPVPVPPPIPAVTNTISDPATND